MNIAGEIVNGVTVVRFEGNLDNGSSTAAQDYLLAAIERGAARVIMSFDKVDFVSSAGLRVLLLTAKRLAVGGGRLRICSLNESVAEVFEITGFNTIFNVFGSEADALSNF